MLHRIGQCIESSKDSRHIHCIRLEMTEEAHLDAWEENAVGDAHAVVQLAVHADGHVRADLAILANFG